MHQITFSVVIAAYNRHDLIIETIRSVKEQTYSAFEIIVVDDGSADGTADTVKKAYPDVVVYVQPNLGPGIAFNTGVAIAKGEWICFLSDDDLWHRDKLSEMARYIEKNPDADAINHHIWFFSGANGPADVYGFKRDFIAETLDECHSQSDAHPTCVNDFGYLNIRGNSHRLLLERNRGCMVASVVRKETYIRAGGLCPMQMSGDDWTMHVNVARLCEWHTLERPLGFNRLHQNQRSRDSVYGLYTLVGITNAWFTGRPFRESTVGLNFMQELCGYGHEYRKVVQGTMWNALCSGQITLANLVWRVGWILLPRKLDQIYVLIPPQITWRLENLMAKQKRRSTKSR